LADEPEQLDKSPYVAFWNNPVIFDDPSGDCPRCVKTLAKTAIKSIAKGKLDLGDVYDLVDAGKTILDPNASLLDKGLAVFDIVSPISTKEIKAVGNILGVADNLNDAKKAGGKAGDVGDALKNRVKLQKGTKEAVQDAASKTKDGKFIDPNTRKPIQKGQEVYGHKTGQEWSKYKKDPANQGKTRKEVIKDQNDPNKYKIEDRKSNASHKYDEKPK
jgi:hypothetical protein